MLACGGLDHFTLSILCVPMPIFVLLCSPGMLVWRPDVMSSFTTLTVIFRKDILAKPIGQLSRWCLCFVLFLKLGSHRDLVV